MVRFIKPASSLPGCLVLIGCASFLTFPAGKLRAQGGRQPDFYYVGTVEFPGATGAFHYPQLLELANFPAQEPYDETKVANAVTALRQFFVDNGYFLAQVQSETKFDEPRGVVNLVFHVTLHARAKFGRLELVGPPPDESARLTHALNSFRARIKGATLKPGKPYDRNRVRAAIAYLRTYLGQQDRLASDIRLEPAHFDPETNRADIRFQVALGPIVRVQLTGVRVSRKTKRRLVPIYEENAVDRDLVAEGQRNLVSYFQSKGYFDVKVAPHVQRQPSETVVSYQIEKGNKHRVMSVNIAGNQKYSDKDLREQILIKKGNPWSHGTFSQTLLNRSIKNLTAFYQNAGFAEANVQPDVVDREPKVYVTFKISEGQPTLVDSLRMDGNETQSAAALAPNGVKLKPGQPYSRTRLDDDRNQIVSTYMNLGYLGVDFNSTVKPLAGDPHRVAVAYQIREGPQVTIGHVEYLGRTHTRLAFLQHNTSVRPGAPLSEGKLLGSESRLYNLGTFDWANVAPRRPITNQTEEDVLVKVHDAKRNSVTYGVGFESTPRGGSLSSSGLVALPGLPTVGLPPAFKIIEKAIISPLGSVEYTRLNLRGRAETASIATLISRLDQRASFTYTDPQLHGMDWNALWSFSAERTTQNPLFTARLGSASLQVEKILNAERTERLQFRYIFQRTTLTDLLIKNFVLPEDTNVRASTLAVAFLRDTRDKPLDAHRGVFQTLNFGFSPTAIGSSNNVWRFFGQSSFYKEVRPWMVWANNFRLGLTSAFAGSHVPISERFFSGGADSLRGFPLNGAGPQEAAQLCTSASNPASCIYSITVPEGGHQLFIFNSEGRFPIPVKSGLGGVIFYDGGNVYRAINLPRFFQDYSNSVGIGLRYQTPVGPLRIDVGHNLHPVPGLHSTNLFVTLGQSF